MSANPIRLTDIFGLKEHPDEFVGPLSPDGYYTAEMTHTKCGRIPPTPPGAYVTLNMSLAQDQYNPFWLYNQVRNRDPWNYKQFGAIYQDFGNFNHGASGYAMGFPEATLLS